MTKTAKRILSLWLTLQVLVSSVGFTLTERKCSMAEVQERKKECCKTQATPKKERASTQTPSCCNKKTFEEIFGDDSKETSSKENSKQVTPKPCCNKNGQNKEHNCCTFDIAHHHIAFKNYTISSKKYEIKQQKQSFSFVAQLKIDLKRWLSITTQVLPKHNTPPPKPSKHLLSLYATFLI